jgi:uncharacterized phiE125 gp8 family phage protein
MGLIRLTTTPIIIDVTDLKSHLRIDGTADDNTLDAIQRAAVDHIERVTHTQIGAGSFRLTLDAFPQCREINIPRPPLTGVSSIKYIDSTGAEVVLDPGVYRVDVGQMPGRIVLKDGKAWPHTAHEAACVTIDFTAGYASDSEPETIRHLIRLITGAWFECREGATDRRFDEIPLPFAVTS